MNSFLSVSSSASFITLDKSLTIADNNTIIKCFLYDAKHETKTIKEINLVLRMSSSRKAMAIDTEGMDCTHIMNTKIYSTSNL